MSDSGPIIPIAPFVSREPGQYPGQLRPKGPNSIDECDWGYCDRDAVLERFSPSLGWLAVCDICAQKPWAQALTEGHR